MNLMLNVKEGRPPPERKGSYEWLKTMCLILNKVDTKNLKTHGETTS